jgi:hypothetical protein
MWKHRINEVEYQVPVVELSVLLSTSGSLKSAAGKCAPRH